MKNQDSKICPLKSLNWLLGQYERFLLIRLSVRIIDFLRERDPDLELFRSLLLLLKRFSSVTPQNRLNYTAALIGFTGKTKDPEEKHRRICELIDLAKTRPLSVEIIELTLRTLLTWELEAKPPYFGEDLADIYYQFFLKVGISPDVHELCALGWFNLAVSAPTVEEKRRALTLLMKTVLLDKSYTSASVLEYAAKGLVNFMEHIRDYGMKMEYLAQVKSLIFFPKASPEMPLIYARGLAGALAKKLPSKERNFCLSEFKKIVMHPKVDMQTCEIYLHILFKLALEAKSILSRRKYIRRAMELMERQDCSNELFRICAQLLFNHVVDEVKISEKRKTLQKIEYLVFRSKRMPSVLNEYARALVNVLVDDEQMEEKENCLTALKELCEESEAPLNIVLEYAKGLVNMALVSKSKERKLSCCRETMKIYEKQKDFSLQKFGKTTVQDFHCIYAQALFIVYLYESDDEKKSLLLEKIPPWHKFAKSDYTELLNELAGEIAARETNFELKKKVLSLREYLERFIFQKHLEEHLEESDEHMENWMRSKDEETVWE